MNTCKLKHFNLHCVAILVVLVTGASCELAQTTEAPDVVFIIEPKNMFQYLNAIEVPLNPPIFNCKISGLTDEMEGHMVAE